MTNLEIILTIAVIAISIALIIFRIDELSDKAIITRQQNTIKLLEDRLDYSSNHIGKLNSQLDELKAELHTIKFPATEFIHFSVLCKQNNVQWYKDKVREIFDKITSKDVINEKVYYNMLSDLVWYNKGYLDTKLNRVDYYIQPKNREEFKSCIDKFENDFKMSILDVIKE